MGANIHTFKNWGHYSTQGFWKCVCFLITFVTNPSIFMRKVMETISNTYCNSLAKIEFKNPKFEIPNEGPAKYT